jgi:hypothetical protein
MRLPDLIEPDRLPTAVGRITDAVDGVRAAGRPSGHIHLVVVDDESTGQAERPERAPVEQQVQVRQPQLAVVIDVRLVDRGVVRKARVTDPRGKRRNQPETDVRSQAGRAGTNADSCCLRHAAGAQCRD